MSIRAEGQKSISETCRATKQQTLHTNTHTRAAASPFTLKEREKTSEKE